MLARFDQLYRNPSRYNPATGLFNLRNEGLMDANIPSLCEFLGKHPDIKSLDLDWNHITVVGATLLAKNDTLATLQLNRNKLGVDGATALAKNKTLTALSLGGNKITDAGAAALAKNNILTSLSLVASGIRDTGAAAFAQNHTLAILRLSSNEITDVGATALATADKPGFSKYKERYLAILSIFNHPSKNEASNMSDGYQISAYQP